MQSCKKRGRPRHADEDASAHTLAHRRYDERKKLLRRHTEGTQLSADELTSVPPVQQGGRPRSLRRTRKASRSKRRYRELHPSAIALRYEAILCFCATSGLREIQTCAPSPLHKWPAGRARRSLHDAAFESHLRVPFVQTFGRRVPLGFWRTGWWSC